MLKRATPFEFAPEFRLPTCSAEDLFIMKSFAARPQDWMDAEGVAVRQEGRMEIGYILRHLADLCELKEAPEILEKARKILGCET